MVSSRSPISFFRPAMSFSRLLMVCSSTRALGTVQKEKTTPFGVNLMRSQVLYRAAQPVQLTIKQGLGTV